MEPDSTEPNDKFSLVQQLAKDLSGGDLELSSFPDIALRIRKALNDDMCTTEQIVQILGAEPVLAAKILSISNSAALRPSTDPITDLPMAVNRIGRNMVRNTAMSFAMVQTEKGYSLKEAKARLDELWDECAHVAALCYVLTKKYTPLNPDEALLVGLMHGVGKLYILGRAEEHPTLFNDEEELVSIMNDWHTGIGSAIIEKWGFADYVASAVANYKDLDRDNGDSAADYTDILTIACILSEFVRSESDMEVQLDNIPASKHLRLTSADIMPTLQASDQQIRSLRHALGK
ncbi:MAG: HDOD domain-containing protein [Gammaproteobacteria bacterium]|nr:HDOD domain-containing protein [Gammaproteobacteria bacterium]